MTTALRTATAHLGGIDCTHNDPPIDIDWTEPQYAHTLAASYSYTRFRHGDYRWSEAVVVLPSDDAEAIVRRCLDQREGSGITRPWPSVEGFTERRLPPMP